MIELKRELILDIPVIELFETGKEFDSLPTVVFYHGWESRKERVLEYGYYLASNGIRTILPEALNHGERQNEKSQNDPMSFWEVVAQNVKELPILMEHYINSNKVDENSTCRNAPHRKTCHSDSILIYLITIYVMFH